MRVQSCVELESNFPFGFLLIRVACREATFGAFTCGTLVLIGVRLGFGFVEDFTWVKD